MPLDEIKFGYLNWKSPFIIIPLLVFLAPAIFFSYFGLRNNMIEMLYIGLSSFAVPLMILFPGMITKIKLNSKGIEYSSIFKTVFLEWKDIKTFGCYMASRYSNINVHFNEIDTFNIWGQKFLFLSIEENYSVGWGKKANKNFISFHFRRGLVEKIKKYLRQDIVEKTR